MMITIQVSVILLTLIICLIVAAKKIDANRKKIRSGEPLQPESQFIVSFDKETISCKDPTGIRQEIKWNDLQSVELMNTDEGPFLPDIFWILSSSKIRLSIPQGATGEKELLARLQELPDFDNEAVIKSAKCASNQIFSCWKMRVDN